MFLLFKVSFRGWLWEIALVLHVLMFHFKTKSQARECG
jgi:hypothetical protein